MGQTKKDFYNENKLVDKRTHVNGETAIKPYWYIRNGLLHIRYTVDRCIELSEWETERIKSEIADSTDKQKVLEKHWKTLTDYVGKPIIMDGIAEIDRRIKGGN